MIIKNLMYIIMILSLNYFYKKEIQNIPGSNNIANQLPFDSINEWKSGFFISWRGTPDENVRSAKALGYRYINETCEIKLQTKNYGPIPAVKGMRFYLDNPEYSWLPELDYIDPDMVTILKSKTFGLLFTNYPKWNTSIKDQWFIDLKAFNPSVYESVKATYEKNCCIADGTKPFPENLALGYGFPDGSARIVLDWQQQKVIDSVVGQVIKFAHERENIANDYLFGGITMDVPEKWNEFIVRPPNYNHTYTNYKIDPALSGYEIPGTKHNYSTFREGWMRFMLTLRGRLANEFTDRSIRLIVEPWKIWGWIDTIDGAQFLTKEEKKKIVGDLVMQEGPFIDEFNDRNIINKLTTTGLISFDNLGSSCPNLKDKYYDPSISDTHLNYMGRLASKGIWFNSYGRFDSKSTTIKQRLPQLTLSRLLVNWQNLTMIPMKDRTWDAANQVYNSPNGHADKDIIYCKEPHSDKYYAVWVNNTGVMKLQKGEMLVSIRSANEYYEENGAGSNDAISNININRETITLSESGKLNQCYIITIKI